MAKEKLTQNERIIEYLEKFGSITQYEALRDLGVMRLASRISDLRKAGWSIESEMATVTNRFGEKCSVARYKMKGGCSSDEKQF